MKKKMRKALRFVFLAVLVVSTAMILIQWMDNSEGDAAYQNAVDIALQAPQTQPQPQPQPQHPTELPTEPEEAVAQEQAPVTVWVPVPVEDDPVMEEMAQINLAALRETNPDVLGWIRIPDTKIDYPLMQGTDNDYYLNHTWDKQANSVGSIFLEYQNSAELTDYNTIIYGHNMKNGSMFGELKNYALQKFWESHPYVYILTDEGVYRYEVFSFFRAEVDSATYSIDPVSTAKRMELLTPALENSQIKTGIVPVMSDRILTLSTCSGMNYANRYVVVARLPMMEVRK